MFLNRRGTTVELFWMDRAGDPKFYGAIWKIVDTESGKELGHFRVGDRKALATVPSNPDK